MECLNIIIIVYFTEALFSSYERNNFYFKYVDSIIKFVEIFIRNSF